MDKFWDFLYFLVGTIGVIFIVKYITTVFIAKYQREKDEKKDSNENYYR